MRRRPHAALAVALALAAAAAHAGPAGAVLQVRNTVAAVRADGTAVPFPLNVRVWCGPWEEDVPARSLHVTVGGARSAAIWSLSAVVSDVRRDRVVELPHSFVFDQPSGALLFMGDGTNELSSAEEESTGRIVFERARCGRRLAVRFRVRGTLGSEFIDGGKLSVRGSFSARLRPDPAR